MKQNLPTTAKLVAAMRNDAIVTLQLYDENLTYMVFNKCTLKWKIK